MTELHESLWRRTRDRGDNSMRKKLFILLFYPPLFTIHLPPNFQLLFHGNEMGIWLTAQELTGGGGKC